MINKTLAVWDIDDTLITTEAYIFITDKVSGEVIKMNSLQFHSHKYDASKYDYDFSYFRNNEKLAENGRLLVSNHEHFRLQSESTLTDVVIVTARSDDTEIKGFRKALDVIGIYNAFNVNIILAPVNDDRPTSLYKKQVVETLLENNEYDCLRCYDDSLHNIQAYSEINSKNLKSRYVYQASRNDELIFRKDLSFN